MTKYSPFHYPKTSLEIIRLAVMLYVRFPLSLRNVENSLSAIVIRVPLLYIRDKINTHQPKVVVFYSTSYIDYWNQIIQGDFKDEKQANTFTQNKNKMRWLIKNGTCFVQVPQPSAARANSFWNDAGHEIRKHIKL